jgi:hypothetical protein
MANNSKRTVAIKIPSRERTQRGKANLGIESKSSRDQSTSFHENSSGKEKKERSGVRSAGNLRGVAPENTRLALLEAKLVERSTHEATPFAVIRSISNPGLDELFSFPVLEYWWESYRTVDVGGSNSILRLQQEVLVGSNVMSNLSTEADARRQCYALQEEVESRIVGYAPILTPDIEVTFALHDVDASFTAMSESGIFILTTYYSMKWQIQKPVRG